MVILVCDGHEIENGGCGDQAVTVIVKGGLFYY